METLWGFASGQNGKFCVCAVEDENTFIQQTVLASLDKEETVEMIAAVLLTVSGRHPNSSWISVTLNDLQLTALGMHFGLDESTEEVSPPLGFVGEEDLIRAFTEVPMPVCMLAGPDHIFTFSNPAFIRTIGRDSERDVLGKPVREALRELQGQPFFGLMDKVYESGEPFVGIGAPVQLRDRATGLPREAFFDFVYHPVRDREGKVCGILCLETEVTERVLEKQVHDAREEQLYRQWAELDAIYRESPLGMCLVEASTLRILRLNKMKTQLLGKPLEDLVGRRIGDVSYTPRVEDHYRDVISSKRAVSFEVAVPFGGNPEDMRDMIWNLNPVLSSTGEVEAIASTVVDITMKPIKLPRAEGVGTEAAGRVS